MSKIEADKSAALDRLMRPTMWWVLAALMVVPILAYLSLNQINQRAAVFEIQAANGLSTALSGKSPDVIVQAFTAAGFDNVRLAADEGLQAKGPVNDRTVSIYTTEGLRRGALTFTLQRPATENFLATIGYKAPIILGAVLVLLAYIFRIRFRAHLMDTQRRRAQKMALTDGLSHLANRRRFDDQLERELANTADGGPMIALYFIDIDYFKKVNDSYGHGVGDVLIKQVGALLQVLAESGDLVARLAGDEFAVIKRDPGSTSAAMAFGHQIVSSLDSDFMIEGKIVPASASVGIALVNPFERLDRSTYCRNADMALYAAKRAGRNGSVLYSADTHNMETAADSLHSPSDAVSSSADQAASRDSAPPAYGALHSRSG